MNGADIMNQHSEGVRAETPVAEAPERRYVRAESRERYVEDPRKKSPWLAAILSGVPGLGQVYVGYYQQGFVNILVVAGLIALTESRIIDGAVEGPLGFFIAFFWLYNIIDAARRASLYNQALSGLRPMDLPEDTRAPHGIGSLGGGIALIAAGLVLFGHTMFGMSLEWLADWWPMALVGAGAWLIFQDRQAKAARAVRAAGPTDAGAA